MLERVKRKFGWLPIDERRYHKSFEGCIHNFNWERYGQCPICARGAMASINWSLVNGEILESFQGIIKASKDK